MDILETAFKQSLSENLKPSYILGLVIEKKFEKLGITLNKQQLEQIENQIQRNLEKNFKINIELNEIQQKAFDLSKNTSKIISLNENDKDLTEILEKITNDVKELFPDVIDEIADILLIDLHKDVHKMIAYIKNDQNYYKKSINKIWKTSFDLLEMLRIISYEAGEKFNSKFRNTAALNNDYVFDVLTRLHARGCQVFSEILVLLRSGFPDGAHARWRTLHELSIIAMFIKQCGQSTAEKFILYYHIESFFAAKKQLEFAERLGIENISDEEFQEMKEIYDDLLFRFGNKYKDEYGWAYEELGNGKLTFAEIEKKVEMDHYRPLYKMASSNVHSGPSGIIFKLGLYPGQDLLLCGPSNTGFADPAFGAAISLSQITITLLTLQPNFDRLVICSILNKITFEVGNSFFDIQDKLENR